MKNWELMATIDFLLTPVISAFAFLTIVIDQEKNINYLWNNGLQLILALGIIPTLHGVLVLIYRNDTYSENKSYVWFKKTSQMILMTIWLPMAISIFMFISLFFIQMVDTGGFGLMLGAILVAFISTPIYGLYILSTVFGIMYSIKTHIDYKKSIM